MPKFNLTSDDARMGDITRWSVAALMCSTLAILSANVANFVPANVINGLHATRVQAGSFNQMRTLLTELRADNGRLGSEYRALLARFNLLDGDSGEVIRRLAAVENSLPLLIESLPLTSDIDRSLLTASIATSGGEVYEAEGGSISVRQSPLFDGVEVADALVQQPMPAALPETATVPEPAIVVDQGPKSNLAMQGIAVGEAVPVDEIVSSYSHIIEAAGTLLMGTAPLVSTASEDDARVVLGPLPDRRSADDLCARLVALALACEPVSYEGAAWPL